ncbi:acyl-coenzyme A synthetase/AMP-(fatty) acid ligase [Microbacterium endophyticum]|uniref:Acyl-coenzyme A synthetase/AMP-(Fatty) acid ligase n=1 Tax=Microbacterium endophyticum TaxID=1526412 RepID=A0A7W4V241_9MICO|nr:acyl-coenzyme A synthetase/AMP-(fatty) acid ligase [Microbacterium endophyticum]NIK37321.1 acyl-coenzyme A synthetase/AMP-(fatty) acid ligase [Microbacterium endophyticum]
MIISDRRLSAMEIEAASVSYKPTTEPAIVGAYDDTSGQAAVAFRSSSKAAEDPLRKDHAPFVAGCGRGS